MIIGLDVGGTHTDVVLLGQEGLVRQIKVPTNPADLFATVLTGLEKITEGIDPARISRAVLVHHPGHQPHRAGSDPRGGNDRFRRSGNGSRTVSNRPSLSRRDRGHRSSGAGDYSHR